eukprot:7380668-Prymnesium_polylepis.1
MRLAAIALGEAHNCVRVLRSLGRSCAQASSKTKFAAAIPLCSYYIRVPGSLRDTTVRACMVEACVCVTGRRDEALCACYGPTGRGTQTGNASGTRNSVCVTRLTPGGGAESAGILPPQ